MDQYITEEVPEPQGDEGKDNHNNNMSKVKRIIVDYNNDHIISHVSSFNTLKEIYDALKNMFEGNNITRTTTRR